MSLKSQLHEPQPDELNSSKWKRLNETLGRFDVLPAEALIDITAVCAVLGRSPASVWRDAAGGRLAPPIRVGIRSTRWRVGDVRAALRGQYHQGDFDAGLESRLVSSTSDGGVK